MDWKRFFGVGGRSSDRSEGFLETDNGSKTFVAVLSVNPRFVLGTKCEVEERDLDNEKEDGHLLKDPVSLCIVGGLQDFIQARCNRNPAHRFSWRGLLTLVVYGGASVPCLLWLLARDPWMVARPLHVLVWYAAASLGWILVCREHGRAFSRSVDVSGLASERATILNPCGYELEARPCPPSKCQKFAVYKKEGTRQSLPAIGAAADESEEADAQKSLLLLESLGVVRYPMGRFTNPPFPLDFWTIHGLLLGRTLNINARMWHLERESLGLLMAQLYFSIRQEFWWANAACVSILALQDLQCYRWVDRPKLHAAKRDLVSRLSPLITDRHDGCSLRYEVRPGVECDVYSVRRMQELFVLEGQPRDDGVNNVV